MINKIPNPGSNEAILQGCKCPVFDNHYGKGTPQKDGAPPAFWYSTECHLHYDADANDIRISFTPVR